MKCILLTIKPRIVYVVRITPYETYCPVYNANNLFFLNTDIYNVLHLKYARFLFKINIRVSVNWKRHIFEEIKSYGLDVFFFISCIKAIHNQSIHVNGSMTLDDGMCSSFHGDLRASDSLPRAPTNLKSLNLSTKGGSMYTKDCAYIHTSDTRLMTPFTTPARLNCIIAE